MSQRAMASSHGPLQDEVLVENKKEDVNILILGETGVGKSTMINAIANYAKHHTLQDAMDDPEFTVLIPSRFIFTDEEENAKEIKIGSDENEVFADGQSATQFPREYVIETDTTKFHLIDTPGIGDSRGIEQDKENFDNILAFLTNYDKINAVVVLLKPNNSRMTVAFRFCVMELLSYLHKSIVSNIIFAFTNTRGTFYRPGDSLQVLSKLLEENKIEIDLSPESYFCFDNEAFRFLACIKNGIKFAPEDVDLYSKSWVNSWETTGKLVQFVMTKQPHETKMTLSLNEAKSCIIAMSKPMGQAIQLIEMNVKKINGVKDQCKRADADIKKLQEHLKFKAFQMEIKQLPYPRTVCADKECKKFVNVGESSVRKTVYPQICHDPCKLKGIAVETTNNEQLRACKSMSIGNCKICKHDYRCHMHITYTADLVEKEFLSKHVLDLIQRKADVKSKKEAFIEKLERSIKELKEEKEFIFESASFFSVFLKENALIPYNDSFSEYLDMLIQDEEAKEKPIRDDKKIEQLKKEKKAYDERKTDIMKNIESGSKDEVLPIGKVEELKKKLCSLQHNGKTLTEALDAVKSARMTTHKEESETASRRVKGSSHGPLQDKVHKKKEDVNILILGETGVGKSTWINGIANYAKHNTLKDAMDDPDFTVLIPSRFIFTDEEGEGKEIKVGSDDNEVLADGQSATQFPREYVIETDTTKFHLIDTPGIGDSRGIEKDKENFENILAFLTCYDKINAVVVLFKPNNARLTVAFRFCVLELLTHLHKSIVSNIIFAFTNSRGTFYRPGDSLPVLKGLLQKKNIAIDLSPKSYFCFDNEAFRFLACSKSGIEFTDEEAELYSKSWVKSCETTGKLFQLVTTKKPHETKETLSLNEARSCIIAISKPMGEAAQLIAKNVKKINDTKEQCESDDADIKQFMTNLKFKGYELEITKLPYPRTVCTDEDCKRYVNIGESGERNTIYPQICHHHCGLSGVPVQTTNNEQLRGCAAMDGDKCCRTGCGHDYRLHMHITYTAELKEKEFLSKEVQEKIDTKSSLKAKKEAFIAELETRKKELEEENEIIYESASIFGVFLNENALIPYNDSFSEYLDMLIKEEEAKEDVIIDRKRIEQLKKDKKAYEERKNVIMKNIESGIKDKNEVIPLEKVEEMRKKLCSLKHNGKTLNEALDAVVFARKATYKVKRTQVVIAKASTLKKVGNAISSGFQKVGSAISSGVSYLRGSKST
ncbi:uncharacterized protein LOC144634224 [Oculina patagonica]